MSGRGLTARQRTSNVERADELAPDTAVPCVASARPARLLALAAVGVARPADLLRDVAQAAPLDEGGSGIGLLRGRRFAAVRGLSVHVRGASLHSD